MVNFDSGTKVPVLRFKDEMGKEYPEWKFRPFSEVYSFKPTKSLSRNQLCFDKDSNISYIHYGDIHTKFRAQFVFSDEIVPFVSSDVDIGNIPCDMYCQDGDLVIADASEDYVGIGKTIEIIDSGKGKIVAGLHTFLARPKLRLVYIGFAAQMMLCEYVRLQIKLIAQGTKVLGVSTNRLKTIILPLPCIYEQLKITNFLSSVDTRIEELEKKKTLLEEYKKGLMQKLFSQEIRFKDDQGMEYPDWVETRLGEISTSFSGGTPTSTNKDYYSGDIPFIKSGEISNSITENSITEQAVKKSAAKKVRAGDVLYALYGATSGEVAIAKVDGAINQAVLCIRSQYDHQFLFQFLKFRKTRIISTFIQGGQGNLSAGIIKSVRVNLPSTNEQQKIANFLSSVDRKIELIAEKIIKTREFKKGLLQQMFV